MPRSSIVCLRAKKRGLVSRDFTAAGHEICESDTVAPSVNIVFTSEKLTSCALAKDCSDN